MTDDEQLGHALVHVMARRCGLQDPEVFAAKPLRERLNADYVEQMEAAYGPIPTTVRGTGRTTHMLLQALVALEVGATVEIVGSDSDHALALSGGLDRLAEKASVWWPVDPEPVRYRWEGCSYDPNAEVLADVRLVDHAVGEA